MNWFKIVVIITVLSLGLHLIKVVAKPHYNSLSPIEKEDRPAAVAAAQQTGSGGHPCYAEGQDCLRWLENNRSEFCSWTGRMVGIGAYKRVQGSTRESLPAVVNDLPTRKLTEHERGVTTTLLYLGYDSGLQPEEAGPAAEASCLELGQ